MDDTKRRTNRRAASDPQPVRGVLFCCRMFNSSNRCSTSTVSAFPSALCTPRDRELTGRLPVTNDVTRYTKAKFLSQIGKKTEVLPTFLDCCRRTRGRRCRTRREGICSQVLHRRRQLGHAREYARVFCARPVQIPAVHPHTKAPPRDQHAGYGHAVGLLVAMP